MKRFILSLVLGIIAVVSFGQAQNPVNWTYEAKKKSADTYDVVITALVEKPWHIYSQNTGKGGPVPTSISFKANPLVKKSGVAKEVGKLEKHYDENFQTNVLFFADKVQFVQTVKVKPGIKTNLSGTIEYMVCDDSRCLPPVKKSFDLKLM